MYPWFLASKNAILVPLGSADILLIPGHKTGVKGTVHAILGYPPFHEWHFRFSTVPFKTLYDQE